jgi:hypothetical protein
MGNGLAMHPKNDYSPESVSTSSAADDLPDTAVPSGKNRKRIARSG